MKRSTLLLAAATTLLVTASASAQTMADRGLNTPHVYQQGSSVAAEYRVIDSLANAFSYYSTSAEPVKYDPLLNILATIKRGNPGQSGNRLFIYASSDLGTTWSGPFGPLHDPAAAGSGPARYPSIVVNPTHSNNPQEYFFYYTSPVLLGGAFGGLVTGLVDKAGNEIIPPHYSGGIDGELYSSDTRSIESGDGQTVVTVANVGENALAVRRLDLGSGALTESIPAQFAADKFSPVPGGGRTSTTGGIGRDATGAIHLLVWARTPGTDAASDGDSLVMPLLSKSSDNGATWSEMVALPGQVLRDYAASQGFTAATTRYGPTGFAVTGPDRASIAFGLYESDTTVANPINQIVEARYNNGTWGMFKIADVIGWYDLDNGGGSLGSQVENEIQLVATADGNTLVAKWVDATTYTYTEDIDANGEGNDTLGTTDVFVATRATSQGTWSAPKNVTESPILDRLTWIPVNVLPNDLTRLPIISVQTTPDATLDTTISVALFHGQRVLVDRPQYVVVTNVDATTGPSSAPITGEVSASTISSIIPNPTAGSATVSINVARSGHGSIELWTAVGERVAVLANGTLEAGAKTFNIDGAALPVGAYYVAMKIDGQTITRPLSVVR